VAALALDALLDEPVPCSELSSELYDFIVGPSQQLPQVAVALLKHLLLRGQQGNLIVPLLQLALQTLKLLSRRSSMLLHPLRQSCIAARDLAQLSLHFSALLLPLLHVDFSLCESVAEEGIFDAQVEGFVHI
jgi:hypothetical protein